MARKKQKSNLLVAMWPVWAALAVLVVGASALILIPMLTDDETVSIGQAVELPPAARADLDAAGVRTGASEAALVIYEFADYACPACRRFHATLEQIKPRHVDSGDVRLVFLDYPLRGIDAPSGQAAIAARCAHRQDAFEGMQQRLFAEQGSWSERSDPRADFERYARDLELDEARFARCLRSSAVRAEVERSASLGQRLGVNSTPSVLVGSRFFAGAPGIASLRAAIAHELDGGAD